MRHLILTALFASSCAFAQTYVWTDENGRKHYSDQPPPPAVKSQERRFGPNGDTRALPYQVRQASKNNPVTLYTGESCPLCEDARKLLAARRIPFAEKKIESQQDLDALTKRFDGDGIVPSIEIGTEKFAGYVEERWHSLLNEAGYPKDLKGLQ